MSSFLCFICHSTVNAETNEETREKYREIVGIHLCPDGHLCYICCHVMKKLWLFRSVCMKRSLEYPVLFNEKGTINLQHTDTEIQVFCPDEQCEQHRNSYNNHTTYHYNEHSSEASNDYIENNGYVEFDTDYFDQDNYVGQSNVATAGETPTDTDLNQHQELVNDNCSHIKDIDVVENEAIYHTQSHYDSDKEDDRGIDTDTIKNLDNCSDVVGERETDEAEGDTVSMEKDEGGFIKIMKTLEEQKAELESNRRSKKYLEAEFKCYNCALGFLLKESHQAHMMRHEESNGEYQCKVCTLRFGSASGERHHRTLHAARFVCACGRSVPPSRRAAHRRRCAHMDRPACHSCGNRFADKSSLSRHLKRFHGPQSTKTYSCNVCGEVFANQAAVSTHMIKHINRKFACPECPATFSSPYTRRAHVMRHAPTTETHSCEACGVSYRSRKGLLAHYARAAAHQHTRYDCSICGRSYTREGLTSHIRRVHGDETKKKRTNHVRPAVCHKCGAIFQNSSKLNRHLKIVCEKDKQEEEITYYQ